MDDGRPIVAHLARSHGLRRTARMAGGWLILGVGVVFAILPVVPGLPLIVLATVLLAPDVPAIARARDRSMSWRARLRRSASRYHSRFTEDFRRRFEP